MLKLLMIMIGLSFIACGDDLGDAIDPCGDGAECAPDKTCDRAECPPKEGEPGSIRCAALESPENGVVVLPEDVTAGARALYRCESGHALVGAAERICNEAGEWEGEEPSCAPILCLASTSASMGRDDGLDLDGIFTVDRDAPRLPHYGCAYVDGKDGVDNAFSSFITSLSGRLGEVDLADTLERRFGAPRAFDFESVEAEGALRLTLRFNGEAVVEDMPLERRRAGVFAGELGTVPLHLEELEWGALVADLTLTLHNAQAEVNTKSGELILGGTLLYGGEGSGDRGIGGLITYILVRTYGQREGDFRSQAIALGARGYQDISLGGEECDGISFGLRLSSDPVSCE